MTEITQKEHWEKIYSEIPDGELPWNSKTPSQELIKLIETNKIKQCKALDIGCGAGTNSIYLAEKGFEVTGIDISEKAIYLAKEKDKEKRCNFISGDVLNLYFKKKEFDFVYDGGCLHHINKKNHQKYLDEIKRVLNDGGSFLLLCFADDLRLKLNPKRLFSKKYDLNFFSKRKLVKLFSKDFEIKNIGKLKLNLNNPYVEVFYSCFMVKK